ncbi:MAG: hypothetical protein OIN86_04700 [Candidatus Methanoperedens sp.]|nr:hypothetical protein [Candidatus Methanoperedens sp.]CAG0996854.1 hypothetical protein METP1_02623 [Methanosarcinales archaeon]
MVFQKCQKCGFTTEETKTYAKHMLDEHKIDIGQGYFEGQQETPQGKKSLQHQITAFKNLFSKDRPQDKPITLPPPKKPPIQPPVPWMRGLDNSFNLEISLGTTREAYRNFTKVLIGKVTQNHCSLILYTYMKDLEELEELQEKEKLLESRLEAYTTSDDAFVEIATSLNKLTNQIKDLKKNSPMNEHAEIILEEHIQSDDNEKLKLDFMNQCLREAQQLEKNHRRTDDKAIEKSIEKSVNKVDIVKENEGGKEWN